MPRALKQNPSGPGYVEIADIEQLNVGNILPLAGALTIRGSTVDPRLLLGYGSGTVYVGRPQWVGQQDNVHINTVPGIGGASGDFTLSSRWYSVDVNGNNVIGGNLTVRNHGDAKNAFNMDGLDIGGPGGAGNFDRIGTLWSTTVDTATLLAKECNLHGTNHNSWWINEDYSIGPSENVGLGFLTLAGVDVHAWHLWYDVLGDSKMHLQFAVNPHDPTDFNDGAFLKIIDIKSNGAVELPGSLSVGSTIHVISDSFFDVGVSCGDNSADIDHDLVVNCIGLGPSNPALRYIQDYHGFSYSGPIYFHRDSGVDSVLGVEANNGNAILSAWVEGPNAYTLAAKLQLFSNEPLTNGYKGWEIFKNPTTHDLMFYMQDEAHGMPVCAMTLLYDEGSFVPTLSLHTGVEVSKILNETEMVSDDDMALATQHSIKAYVDNRVAKAQNMDIDIGTEVVDSLLDTDGDACWWFYVVKNGANLRAGTVMACWESGTNAVRFIENSTADIGDTSGLTLSVGINVGTDEVELRATAASDDWSVRVDRMKLYTAP